MNERSKRVYTALALVCFNSSLLFGGVLLVLWLFLPPATGGAFYSEEFDLDSYTRTPRAEAEALGRDFDRMGEQASFQFDPWTLFHEREFASDYLNVLPDGVRRTLAPDPATAGLPPLRVWAFGGSTMFGWGVSDSQTIPSHLQPLLQARLPQRHVQVTNYGHGYFTSSMELSYFLSLLRDQEPPEVALFLDGLNDSVFLMSGRSEPFFAATLDSAWEREREQRLGLSGDLPWITLNRSFPVFRLLERLRESGDPTLASVQPNRPERVVAFAVSHLRTNIRAVRGAGDALGIQTYHFLQPMTEVAPGNVDVRPNPVASIYHRLQNDPVAPPISLSAVLAGFEQAYVDDRHYSDHGCYLIAEAMVEVIANQ